MKSTSRFSAWPLAFAAAVALSGTGHLAVAAEDQDLLAAARTEFKQLPAKMPGSENDTAELIELGRRLYFEERISINGTQSCNTCHRLDQNLAGVDNLPTSPGAIEGKRGTRNSPTVLNAGFHLAQFWDGREADLAGQAKGPVLNPVEMAMPDEQTVLQRLEQAGYAEAFRKVFPDATPALSYDNFAKAVAAFERTLITRDRFDDFLGGQLDALTAREKKGLAEFMNLGCTECHQGALLGADRYEKIGRVNEYPNKDDLGRFDVTKKDKDKFVFKVPSLRNIALTGPYFHDGRAATLEEAVTNMGHLQLGEELNAEQVGDLVAFLNSLSDKERSKPAAKTDEAQAAQTRDTPDAQIQDAPGVELPSSPGVQRRIRRRVFQKR